MASFPNTPFDQKVKARFWDKVKIQGENECWIWTAYKGSSGYGLITIDGKPQRAHRVSYAIANKSIPDGMLVCHHCDNPSCVNPAHLFLGTSLDNNLDKARKGRNVRPPRDESLVNHARGERNKLSKMTEADVIRVRRLKAEGARTADLAAEYGVDRTLIWKIYARKFWRHVP